jgi:hypothetical protein
MMSILFLGMGGGQDGAIHSGEQQNKREGVLTAQIRFKSQVTEFSRADPCMQSAAVVTPNLFLRLQRTFMPVREDGMGCRAFSMPVSSEGGGE